MAFLDRLFPRQEPARAGTAASPHVLVYAMGHDFWAFHIETPDQGDAALSNAAEGDAMSAPNLDPTAMGAVDAL